MHCCNDSSIAQFNCKMNKIRSLPTLPVKWFQIMFDCLMKTILHIGALMKSTSLYRMDPTKWPCSLLSQFDALRWVIMKEKVPCWGCTMGSNRGCFRLCLSGSFHFLFFVFGPSYHKRKNQQSCLFTFCKKIHWFFRFWSLWPKTEKWKLYEPDNYHEIFTKIL